MQRKELLLLEEHLQNPPRNDFIWSYKVLTFFSLCSSFCLPSFSYYSLSVDFISMSNELMIRLTHTKQQRHFKIWCVCVCSGVQWLGGWLLNVYSLNFTATHFTAHRRGFAFHSSVPVSGVFETLTTAHQHQPGCQMDGEVHWIFDISLPSGVLPVQNAKVKFYIFACYHQSQFRLQIIVYCFCLVTWRMWCCMNDASYLKALST